MFSTKNLNALFLTILAIAIFTTSNSMFLKKSLLKSKVVNLQALNTSSCKVLGASGVSDNGLSHVNGDVCLTPGVSIVNVTTSFVTGVFQVNDGPALAANSDANILYSAVKAQVLGCVYLTGVDLGLVNQFVNGSGQISGHLTPGCYIFTSAAAFNGILTLSGAGDYTFNVGSALVTGIGANMVLTNGASQNDIFWAISSSATISSGSTVYGNFIAYATLTMTNVNLHGTAKALTAAVDFVGVTLS